MRHENGRARATATSWASRTWPLLAFGLTVAPVIWLVGRLESELLPTTQPPPLPSLSSLLEAEPVFLEEVAGPTRVPSSASRNVMAYIRQPPEVLREVAEADIRLPPDSLHEEPTQTVASASLNPRNAAGRSEAATLDELRFLGSLGNARWRFALVRSDGQTEVVAVGDAVGDGYLVAAVGFEELLLETVHRPGSLSKLEIASSGE